MMSGIRGKDTRPEIILRRGLHARGFRFQLHRRDLPGKPDLTFPKFGAVLLAHGCFWHGHDCHLFKWPATRPDFWREKIAQNKTRDEATFRALRAKAWRVGKVWECALKGRMRLEHESVIDRCSEWLTSSAETLEISGCETRPPFRVF
jgi:DNA mismatch endonuclease (patch repair protein)